MSYRFENSELVGVEPEGPQIESQGTLWGW